MTRQWWSVFYCVLVSLNAKFRSEKDQTRNHSTANNFISPNTVAWKTQSHTVGFLTEWLPTWVITFSMNYRTKGIYTPLSDPHYPQSKSGLERAVKLKKIHHKIHTWYQFLRNASLQQRIGTPCRVVDGNKHGPRSSIEQLYVEDWESLLANINIAKTTTKVISAEMYSVSWWQISNENEWFLSFEEKIAVSLHDWSCARQRSSSVDKLSV